MNIGDNLRVLRTKQNISQQDIADYLDIDRKTYISWEQGEADIKSSYIPKLAEFFHVEINDLFKEKVSNIVINQHNTDNKDASTNNSIVLLITDKEAVEQVMDIIKKRVGNQ
jgi:transcriptional regulator with XRE-family HTH domain